MPKIIMSKMSLLSLCLQIIAVAASFGGVVNGHGIIEDDVAALFELSRGDFKANVTSCGARIVSAVVPDKYGKPVDIVLGYDSIKEYLNDTNEFGAIVGRVTNRIGGAQFNLNGIHYKLEANDGNNTLNGGSKGFSKVIWKVKEYAKYGPNPFIVLSYDSFDGEEGFPGNLSVTVTYTLLYPYKLSVTMQAKALNKATPVNLAQHSYWNLGGHNSGDILSDEVRISGSRYTVANHQFIPTGEIAPVWGTPYDFLRSHKVGSRIHEVSDTSGYEINYAIDDGYYDRTAAKKNYYMKLAAIVRSKKTGIQMRISTSAPGMIFYTANHLKNVKGKGGYVYQPHSAYCFETGGFPDAVNHPNFPSTIVYPGQVYTQYMLHEFQSRYYNDDDNLFSF